MNRSEQAKTELQHANEVRFRRAELKKQVKALPSDESRAMLADIIDGPLEEAVVKVPVESFLCWARQMGPSTAREFILTAGCSAGRRVGALTERQRRDLAAQLRLSAPNAAQGVKWYVRELAVSRERAA